MKNPRSPQRFVATIGKAANNFALMQKVYINRLLAEIGIFSRSNTKTYSKVDTKEDMLTLNITPTLE